MAEKLVCPICGEPTRVYMGNARKDRLCGTHADELKAGKLVRNEDGTYSGESVPVKKDIYEKPIEHARQKNGKCIVCSKEAPNGSLCKECWSEMIEYRDTFDKNSKCFELTDHYYNLRSSIYRMQNIEIIQKNCNKLMALAVLVKDLFGNESLTARVVNDIKDIIEKKTPKDINKKTTEESKEKDSQKEELFRTSDGHYVKSAPERDIDDIFYENRIVHCYEKRVPINADEQTIMSDWFIPVKDTRHGIYVEYWGMNTKEYLENKERKRKAYKTHNIPLIEIEKDDIKDKRQLTDRLIGEINALAEKHFKTIDFLD